MFFRRAFLCVPLLRGEPCSSAARFLQRDGVLQLVEAARRQAFRLRAFFPQRARCSSAWRFSSAARRSSARRCSSALRCSAATSAFRFAPQRGASPRCPSQSEPRSLLRLSAPPQPPFLSVGPQRGALPPPCEQWFQLRGGGPRPLPARRPCARFPGAPRLRGAHACSMSSSSALRFFGSGWTGFFWLTLVLLGALALRSASVRPGGFGFACFGLSSGPPENLCARSCAALSVALPEEIDTHEIAIRAAAPRAATLRNVLPRAMGSPLGPALLLQLKWSSPACCTCQMNGS